MEYPHNPMLSPYHKSLSVTICCCSFLIRSFAVYFEPWIEAFSGFWPRFTHIFSAAVMLGSFAIRSPFLAPGYVLEDLELTVGLYKKAAPYAPRARTSLVRDDLEIPWDRAYLETAILAQVAGKGKMVDWNRVVAATPQPIRERVRITRSRQLTPRTFSLPCPCSHARPPGRPCDAEYKCYQRGRTESWEPGHRIRLPALFG